MNPRAVRMQMRDSMPAEMILREKTYPIPSGTTIRHALEKIGVNPDAVLPTREGELLTDDELVREGDRIRLIAVISGGARFPDAISLHRPSR
jgi:sulfur carrier protein